MRLPSILVFAIAGFCTAADRPNIVFILADDLGYGDVGFNGQQHIHTPRLDQMAREGMIFSQFYSGSSVCMPARGTLMTGYHLGQGRIRGNPRWTATGVPVDMDPAKDVTVAQELKRAGYRTAIFGKWGLEETGDGSGLPRRLGFDEFYGIVYHADAHHNYPPFLWRDEEKVFFPENDWENSTGAYSHDVIFAETQAWLAQQQSEEPFFLYYAPTLPHAEFNVPEDSQEQYRNRGWPVREMNRRYYKNDPDGNPAYAGMVSRLDRDIGRLLDQLRDQGLAENTLVIFTSDNGPEFERRDRFFNSNGPLRGGKRDLYEGGIRVPTVAWWPGTITPNSATDHVAAFWDFLPTATELAGVQPTHDDLNGISFAPTLVGQDGRQAQHEVLYWEFNEGAGPLQAVRFGDWKAVKHFEEPLELYDLSADLGESQNVANDFPEIRAQAKEHLEQSRTFSEAFPLTKRKPHASPRQKYD